MTWILTASGQQVDLLNPRPATINIIDIAHHLSLLNRFCGATVRPYSVAEHSLLVCEIALREYGASVHCQAAALMHDAHEAYVSDLSTPAKQAVGADWHRLEDRFARLVRDCFTLRFPHQLERDVLRAADLRALATERRDLMPPSDARWQVLDGMQPVDWIDLRERGRSSLTWWDWKHAFLDRHQELEYARIDLTKKYQQPTTSRSE